jgi:transcriptional regulator with PAS, ATPase and Fis domain
MKDIYPIFFSNSPKMKKIETIIGEIAKTDIPVLVKGESGTGKDLVARIIHLNSHRRDKPFIKVNCAAIPKGLLESELFGFEKGAFTGAHLKKPGKFELANGGTILLNEIGEIDITIQAKLLQVLQDGEFSRLGGEGDISVNSRVITTTKDHLENSMMQGHFREDLFFRINVMSISLPPLRDRRDQIPLLSQYFLDYYNAKYERLIPSLSSKMLDAFKNYDWPGNVRELENMIKRIVIFGEEEIALQDLARHNDDTGKLESVGDVSSNSPKEKEVFCLKEVGKKAAEAAEKEIIQSTLQKTHWNRKESARLLRVSYKALLYKIQKYGLDDLKGLSRTEETERCYP